MSNKKGWKKFWERFWEKFNNPPNWLTAIASVITIILVPMALIGMAVDTTHNVYAIFSWLLTLFPFAYLLFLTIIAGKRLGKQFVKVADKYKFTRNLVRSYAFRSLFFSGCTLAFNVGYSIFLSVTAIMYDSAWYGALSVYYILLILVRGGALAENAKVERKYKGQPLAMQRAKLGIYRYCGLMTFALVLALSVSVVEMVAEGAALHVPRWAIYVFAVFALYRIITAAYQAVKATKHDNLVVRGIRYVSMSTALVTMLSLETALCVVFPPSHTSVTLLNLGSGFFVCMVIMAIGIYMLSFSVSERRRLKELAQEQGENFEEIEKIVEQSREKNELESIEEKIEEQLEIVIDSVMITDAETECPQEKTDEEKSE